MYIFKNLQYQVCYSWCYIILFFWNRSNPNTK